MFQFAEKRGFYVSVEGADLTGKSFVAAHVFDWITNAWLPSKQEQGSFLGVGTFMKREPSEKYRKEISDVPLSNWLRQLYLFVKQREEEHFGEMCWQGLHHLIGVNHHIVVSDRTYHSSCVYQGAIGRLDNESILNAHGNWLMQPDITLIIDCSNDTFRKRGEARAQFKREEVLASERKGEKGFFVTMDVNEDFQEVVRERYRRLPKEESFKECVVVTNDMDQKSVVSSCLSLVEERLSLWEKGF